MHALTPNQQQVLAYLRHRRCWTSPTEIGRNVGGYGSTGRIRHSSWASPICKRLVELGLVERSAKGHYRAIKLDENFQWMEKCPDCYEDMMVEDDAANYQWLYKCLHCGYEEADDYVDLFGSMSAPYGFT